MSCWKLRMQKYRICSGLTIHLGCLIILYKCCKTWLTCALSLYTYEWIYKKEKWIRNFKPHLLMFFQVIKNNEIFLKSHPKGMFSAAGAEQEHWGGSEHISFADVPESAALTRADLKCFMDIAGCHKSLIGATRLLKMVYLLVEARTVNECHYALIAEFIWCESIHWDVRYLTVTCIKEQGSNTRLDNNSRFIYH